MARKRVRIEGIKDLHQKFAKMGKGVQKRTMETAVIAGLQPIRNTAQVLVPVLTGTLRRSIQSRIVESNGYGASGIVGTNLEYARPVEFGTANRPARPYLRPAFDQERETAFEEVQVVLREAILNAIN
jgi:HK97 gp10 family phage protein